MDQCTWLLHNLVHSFIALSLFVAFYCCNSARPFFLLTFIKRESIFLNTALLKDGNQHQNGEYVLIQDAEDGQLGMFDKPLPCFGCGIGWFSLVLGIVFPLMWYYGTILYFGNYYKRDPRERAGLAANAIVALIFTIAVLITVAIILF